MEETSTAVADAPSSSTPAPSSAPAALTEPTTDRPSFGSALEAFRAVDAQRKQPVLGMPIGAAAGTAEPTPVTGVQPAKPQGPIPFEVHSRALDNARTKARAEVEGEYRSRFGEPAQVAEVMSWAREAATNRVGFLAKVITEALADPELAPQVRSLAGRALGGRAQPVSAEPPPPDFTDGQGNAFYSAKTQQARDEWLVNKVKQEILGEVQPGLQEVGQLKAEREAERAQVQLRQTMNGHLQHARSWPQFIEHEAEIKQALLQAPLTSGHPAEEALLLREVYDRVVGPKLSQAQQAKWLAELRQQAHASTLNPGSTGAPTGIPKSVRAKEGGSFGKALEWALAQQTGR